MVQIKYSCAAISRSKNVKMATSDASTTTMGGNEEETTTLLLVSPV